MPETVFYGWTEAALPSARAEQQATQQWQWAAAAFEYARKVAGYNAQEVASYNNLYSQYETARNNRPDLPEPWPPPVPSFAQIVMTSESSWPYMAYSSTERVCATKVYTPASKPALGEGKIGPRYYPDDDEFFYALPGDTTPNFKKIPGTSADGVFGVFQKHADIQGSPSNTGGEIKGLFIRLKPKAL